MSFEEPKITISGVELTEGQAIVVRMGVGDFWASMAKPDALGTDEHGLALTKNYCRCCKEVMEIIAPELSTAKKGISDAQLVEIERMLGNNPMSARMYRATTTLIDEIRRLNAVAVPAAS